jgi:hypothetical protein
LTAVSHRPDSNFNHPLWLSSFWGPLPGSPEKDNITFWNIESRREQGSIESSFQPRDPERVDRYFNTLAFAPDGRLFATFRRNDHLNVNEVQLWTMDQTPILVKQHRITGSVIGFWPDLKTFVAAADLPDGNGQIELLDMATGEKRWSVTFNEHGTHLWSVSFIANGKVLSAHGGGIDRRTTLWDVTSTPKELGSFSETPIVASSDGKWLASPVSTGAKLVNVTAADGGVDLSATNDRRTQWTTPSFSPDNKAVLVDDLDHLSQEQFLGKWLPQEYNPFHADPPGEIVRVWDIDGCREVLALKNCRTGWFSPDGHVLATLRANRMAIDLWKMPFRPSLGRILSGALVVWMIAVVVCWLCIKTRKLLLSRKC